jgi:YebC/PmpR family DNA-binding regulatory protein
MAGHSKFKNIQHRKGAQDQKRAKIFTKLVREIITAAKAGSPDPELNSKLRHAIAAARGGNLPKDRIDKAIKQASGNNQSDNYLPMRYEGFATGGIALIVETLTDNKNRTASDVRAAFSKYAGNLGETGSVSFMFEHLGIISYDAKIASNEQIMELAIELEALDAESGEQGHTFFVEIENFSKTMDYLSAKFGDPQEACIGWRPKTTIIVDDEDKLKLLLKLIDALEESDDVQKVFGNYEISDALYQKLNQQ